jgi:hypothetical protein
VMQRSRIIMEKSVLVNRLVCRPTGPLLVCKTIPFLSPVKGLAPVLSYISPINDINLLTIPNVARIFNIFIGQSLDTKQ